MTSPKIPHTLRLVIFLLRLTLGLNFFYLGFTSIFNTDLGKQLEGQSLPVLYNWLGGPAKTGSLHIFFEWAFLVIGACLVLGLLTRTASIAGIALTIASFLPDVRSYALTASQFVNDDMIVIMCLLVIVFSNSGTYFGLDKFIHVHFFSQHKK
jgi:uncharacterized membrane protein YphA (DoxX/SURF4 family)